MRKYFAFLAALCLFVGCLAALTVPVGSAAAAAVESKNLIYDQANLLSQQEKAELNALANQYGTERETDIIIFTSMNQANQDVQRITEDFYDDQAPGYDKAHGNAVILTMDMKNRQVYLAGFAKAEDSLDSGRLDKIRKAISPDLTSGNYKKAFERYMTLAHTYMGFKPGVNPDNILFALWFQLGAAVIIGGVIVGIMVYRSGGRITVNRATYEDAGTSAVLEHADQYIRTTVTKSKITKNNGGGSGGGGGGVSRGGHSHSGSKGSF
ncbi:TPM domain-containing protein [Paenibacillus oryzisoli]|uniref:TPM domain-containing protein n=1 Tax=Paenibacillus oryzisoli TaxID=1850517 RepID=UPI003D26B69E